MSEANKIAAEAWQAFADWESKMSDKLGDSFEDLDILARVDIYSGKIKESELCLPRRLLEGFWN